MSEDHYGLDPLFEKAFVTGVCRDRKLYGLIGWAVDPEMLSLPTSQLIMRAVHACAKDAGHGPTSSILVVQRLRRWMRDEGRVTAAEISNAIDLMEDADEAGVPERDALISELQPILKRRMEHQAVRDTIETFSKKGDLSKIQKQIKAVQRLGARNVDLGTTLGAASFKEIVANRSLDRLSTGVDDLDFVLDGGLPRGTQGVAVGGAGDGKSMHLSSIAGVGMVHGLLTGYITLELPMPVVMSRIKANILNVTINDILYGDTTEAEKRWQQLAPKLGLCIVKEMAPGVSTVDDVGEWVRSVEDETGRMMDLLIVDYADKLTAPKEKSEYMAAGVVYEKLRHLVHDKNTWLWTASQATRSKKGRKRIGLEDIADSMHKVRVADLVLTLNGAHTDYGSEIRYWVAKNRYGKSNVEIGPLPLEFEYGRLAPTNISMQWGHATGFS